MKKSLSLFVLTSLFVIAAATALHYRILLRAAEASLDARSVKPESGRAVRAETATSSLPAKSALTVATTDGNHQVAALTTRVDELKKRVAELEDENRALRLRLPPDVADGSSAPPARPPREERRLDPEARAAFQQRRQEMANRMQDTLTEQSEFLATLDAKAMSEEQRANHEKLLASLATVKQFMAEMNETTEPHTITPEARQQMFAAIGTVRELMDKERGYALTDLARSMKYNEADAKQFSDYIKYVIDMTSPNAVFRNLGGGGPGGTGRGGFGGRGNTAGGTTSPVPPAVPH